MNMRGTDEFSLFHLPIKPGTTSRGEHKDTLFPWQILGAVLLHCHKFYGYAILADEMGVGKVHIHPFSLTFNRPFSPSLRSFTSMPNSQRRLVDGLPTSYSGKMP
jgi:hypothetical protein